MDDDVGEYTSHSIQTLSRAVETAEENENTKNYILSSPGQHHPPLLQNIVSVIIPSAISFSVISTVAISCRLLRLRISFYTKFIFYSASGCDRSNYFIDFCRRSFFVTLVRTHIPSAQHECRRRHSISQWCQTTATVSIESAFLHLKHSLVPIRDRKKTRLLEISCSAFVSSAMPISRSLLQSNNNNGNNSNRCDGSSRTNDDVRFYRTDVMSIRLNDFRIYAQQICY